MSIEQEIRLQAQAALGESAAEALAVVGCVFAELREEAYREIEGEAPDMKLLRAKLLVMRSVEERLGAYVRSGQVALKELTK